MSGTELIAVGDIAPDFVAATSEGNTVALAELLQRGHVMLVFYPGNNTPG
ncbi:MAG: redoxin domain-containing protein [Gemmatimonadaceae bacterium]